MSLLAASNVSHAYGSGSSRRMAVSQLSLVIDDGAPLALVGKSGCGKCTLARLLLGLERPNVGEITFRGQTLRRFGRPDWRVFRQEVQLVFQDAPGAVDPRCSVFEVIYQPLRMLRGMTRQQATQPISDLLSSVGLEPELAHRLPGQLSGGQLQRVCLARAIAPGPRLLVLDEAVSNLDVSLQILVFRLLDGLRQRHGLSWLFITHDLRLAERYCDRVVVMDAGRVVEDAPVRGRLVLDSTIGKALQAAILPPMPVRPRPLHQCTGVSRSI